jgi:hypothetical protein
MKDVYPEYSPAPAGFGYRRLPPVAPAVAPLGPSLVYAAVGATLGILTVAMFAGQPLRSDSQMGLTDSVQVISRAVEQTTPPILSSVQAQPLAAPAGNQETAQLASPLKSVVNPSTIHKTPVAYKQHTAGEAAVKQNSSAWRKNGSTLGTHAPQTAIVAAALPAANEAEQPVAPVKAYTFMIEGDMTVAGYDASAGMIQTDEGMTFVIDRGATESTANATLWQDSSANVHYRCDQSSNCTLYRSGLVVPNARRAT